MSRPMNDEEVMNEMNKMVAFIKQEAMEKAREIKIKADEEFAIEKAKLVKQEQQAIDAQYDKKRKGAEVAQKMQLLQRREEHLQDLFSASRQDLQRLASDDARYVQFLEGIITQAFLQVLEPSVTIHARKSDVALVQQAADSAAKTFTDLSGRAIDYDVEGTLSDDGAGGIKLISGTKRITLDNTLDERLRLLEDRMLPEIRKDLFGPNENRKFYT
ncbi:ATPase V1/A1 complex subunit E [Mucidula mucida]|nr:ATPase V1/A1 complex subunit E [Mucidula mucida]